MKNWHKQHEESLSAGERVAQRLVTRMGTLSFLIWSNVFVVAWVTFNVVAIFGLKWDPYPFILLNLVFSWQAFNATPLILMMGNIQYRRDKAQADADFETNRETLTLLKDVSNKLNGTPRI